MRLVARILPVHRCHRHLQHDLVFRDSVRAAALEWALLHGSRSGRSAYQFARDRAGRTALERNDG